MCKEKTLKTIIIGMRLIIIPLLVGLIGGAAGTSVLADKEHAIAAKIEQGKVETFTRTFLSQISPPYIDKEKTTASVAAKTEPKQQERLGQLKNSDFIGCLIYHESSGNAMAKGDYRNGKPMAYGVLQFWEDTFNKFKKKYGMPELQYTNSHHQILLADLMISDGYASHWTTTPKCARYLIG